MKRLLLLLATAATLLAADITGAWEFNVETDMGSGNPSFTFKQDGTKLTGDYSGQLGSAPLTGTVEGDKVEFTFRSLSGWRQTRGQVRGHPRGREQNQRHCRYRRSG